MRPRFRFSLQSLFIAFTIVAVALWWKGRPQRIANALVHRIEAGQSERLAELFTRENEAAALSAVLDGKHGEVTYRVHRSFGDWWRDQIKLDVQVLGASGIAGRQCDYEFTITPGGVELDRFVDHVVSVVEVDDATRDAAD